MRLVEVAGRVFARRVVAAADMPAGKAEPEVDPPAVGFQAFLAALWGAGSHVVDLIEMRALRCHTDSGVSCAARAVLQRGLSEW
jgi:hypothetical protein